MKRALLLAAAVLCGCTGTFSDVAPTPPAAYAKLGHATGEACGTLLLGYPGYSFLPINLNERTRHAYEDAVASVPGATALVDVTIRERWFWWAIGSTRCTTIEGEAIK